jgi:hypothetical protein
MQYNGGRDYINNCREFVERKPIVYIWGNMFNYIDTFHVKEFILRQDENLRLKQMYTE